MPDLTDLFPFLIAAVGLVGGVVVGWFLRRSRTPDVSHDEWAAVLTKQNQTRQELNLLQTKANETTSENATLNTQMRGLEKDRSRLGGQIAFLETEISTGTGQLAETTRDLENTRTKLDTSSTELSDSRTQVASLRSELSETKQTLEASQKDLTETHELIDFQEADLVETRKRATKLDEDLTASTTREHRLTAELQEATVERERLAGELSSTSEQLAAATTRCSQLSAQLATSQGQIGDLDLALDDANQRVDALGIDLRGMRSKLGRDTGGDGSIELRNDRTLDIGTEAAGSAATPSAGTTDLTDTDTDTDTDSKPVPVGATATAPAAANTPASVTSYTYPAAPTSPTASYASGDNTSTVKTSVPGAASGRPSSHRNPAVYSRATNLDAATPTGSSPGSSRPASSSAVGGSAATSASSSTKRPFSMNDTDPAKTPVGAGASSGAQPAFLARSSQGASATASSPSATSASAPASISGAPSDSSQGPTASTTGGVTETKGSLPKRVPSATTPLSPRVKMQSGAAGTADQLADRVGATPAGPASDRYGIGNPTDENEPEFGSRVLDRLGRLGRSTEHNGETSPLGGGTPAHRRLPLGARSDSDPAAPWISSKSASVPGGQSNPNDDGEDAGALGSAKSLWAKAVKRIRN